MIKEFKEFAIKGNLLDLAIAVILGAAFGKIVSSMVNDVLMPPLGLLLGKMDFSNLYINLSGKTFESLAQAKAAGAATINYGLLINNLIDFVIVAFVLFLIVRAVNKMKREQEAKNKDCPFCYSKISVKATRCPNCTSELEKAPSAPSQAIEA